MMRDLWFISAIVLIFSSCNHSICRNSHTDIVAGGMGMPGLFDSLNVRKFQTRITIKTSEISGILIIKKINDSISAGSFINEFGIKGFDFTQNMKGTRISYLIKKLDKWDIRKALENDLHFLFLRPELHTTCTINDKPVFVENISRSVTYVYNVQDQSIERADMYNRANKVASFELNNNVKDGLMIRMEHTDGSMKYEFYELNK
jgi:hypothetical protein